MLSPSSSPHLHRLQISGLAARRILGNLTEMPLVDEDTVLVRATWSELAADISDVELVDFDGSEAAPYFLRIKALRLMGGTFLRPASSNLLRALAQLELGSLALDTCEGGGRRRSLNRHGTEVERASNKTFEAAQTQATGVGRERLGIH